MTIEKRKTKVSYVPFVGNLEHYVGRSALEYYSWAHIDMGIAAFLFLSFILSFLGTWIIMGFVIIFGIVWEILENTILYWIGWRPSTRRDSIVNAIWDIFLVCSGGMIILLSQWLIIDIFLETLVLFYIFGIVIFIAILICYFIGFYITNQNTKEARKERKKLVS
ncbi:MAG: hypothetical protein ACFFD5_12165 [Candidatus Thorarchaeota archaeon]